jgi:hypothetical protein
MNRSYYNERRHDLSSPLPSRHFPVSRVFVQTLALVIVCAAGFWLVAVAVLMAARPRHCLDLLAKMASSLEASNWRLNLTEQGLRLLAGAALIVRSPASKLPLVFEVVGWLIVASSVVILAAPVRWHGAYGAWWSRRLTPPVIRILSPIPAVAGAGLIYAAL